MQDELKTPTSTEVEDVLADGIKDLMYSIARDEPEEVSKQKATSLTQAITRLISQAELRGRIEQVEQDFLSINNEFLLDESHVIDWRDRQLAELQTQLTKEGRNEDI